MEKQILFGFQVGKAYAPPHGKIVLLVSEDLANWEEAAIFDTRR